MSTLERVALAIVAVGLVTTLVLPRRQTPQVVGAFGTAFQRSLGTAMGLTRTAR